MPTGAFILLSAAIRLSQYWVSIESVLSSGRHNERESGPCCLWFGSETFRSFLFYFFQSFHSKEGTDTCLVGSLEPMRTHQFISNKQTTATTTTASTTTTTTTTTTTATTTTQYNYNYSCSCSYNYNYTVQLQLQLHSTATTTTTQYSYNYNFNYNYNYNYSNFHLAK